MHFIEKKGLLFMKQGSKIGIEKSMAKRIILHAA